MITMSGWDYILNWYPIWIQPEVAQQPAKYYVQLNNVSEPVSTNQKLPDIPIFVVNIYYGLKLRTTS
jgi:hypothetical protein